MLLHSKIRFNILNRFYRLKDISVVNDLFSETFSKNHKIDLLTMDNAPAVLGHSLMLINSKYESHILTGIKAVSNIFNVFRDVSITFMFYMTHLL